MSWKRVKQILAHARADGSFKHIEGKSPKAVSGADRNVGAAYNTAIYALILQLDRGGLKCSDREST